jgi:Dolichyl-phosphate-mannose-protein mannosyltransferase
LSKDSDGGDARVTAGALDVRRGRMVVVGVAAIAFVAKAWLAWRTQGQDDTYLWWPKFMQAVHDHGPVGVYSVDMVGQPYNHPPLTGWWLATIDAVRGHGHVPLGFWIRIGSVVADFFCAWVLFEVLRRRQPLWQATAAAALVAASPVLYVISGYHGNHDPEIMFLAILSAFLLVDKRFPALAGVALAAAVSLKLPIAPAVPVVFAAALALGRQVLLRFTVGFAVIIAVLWLPPLVEQGRPFVNNVLLYSGNSFPRQWGPVAFAHVLHVPQTLIDVYISPGRLFLLLLCAAAGAYVAWRRPDLLVAAIGLTMASFLLLSPGYAPQYMVWPVAAIYALSFWPATAYNLGGGLFLVLLYTAWSGGLPWNFTHTVDLTNRQEWAAAAIWLVLGWVVVDGVRKLHRQTGGLALPWKPAPRAVSVRSTGSGRETVAERHATVEAEPDPALRTT